MEAQSEPTTPHRKRRGRLVRVLSVLAIAGAAAGATWLVLRPPPPPPLDAAAAILRFDRDGYRFTYHVPTGDEGLFRLATDPKMLRNLAREEPERCQAMRRELERDIGVERLEDLKDNFSEHIENLRSLGYL